MNDTPVPDDKVVPGLKLFARSSKQLDFSAEVQGKQLVTTLSRQRSRPTAPTSPLRYAQKEDQKGRIPSQTTQAFFREDSHSIIDLTATVKQRQVAVDELKQARK